MKPTRKYTLCAALALTSLSISAHADNASVENALKNQSDLSNFYQALQTTGVIHELQPNMTYTVFAPTNYAFSKLSTQQYPCFYSQDCRKDVADVLRNHIVPHQEYIDTVARQKGGVYSIDKRFVSIAEPNKGSYTVDGHNVVNADMIGGGLVYKIDGVIANPYELSAFQYGNYTPVATEEQTTTTTTARHVDTDCSNDLVDCPQGVSRSTTVTKRTTYTPSAR